MKDFDQMKVDEVLEPPLYPFGMRWDEIVLEEVDRGCYEFLLCSYDLLRPKKYGKDSKDKVAVEEKKIIEDVMRARYNIPRAEYDTMLKALRTVDGR